MSMKLVKYTNQSTRTHEKMQTGGKKKRLSFN